VNIKYYNFATFFVFIFFNISLHAQNQEAENADSRPIDLSPVHVIGTTQGPVILEFVRDDITISVLGEIRPTQKNLDIYATDIEQKIASSHVILSARGVVVGEGIGVLRGLTLWSSIRKVRFINDGRMLSDMVSSNDYALWRELKEKYLPNDNNVEKLKPMYAAWKLYEAAVKHHHLRQDAPSRVLVKRTARSNRIPLLDARYHLRISNPRVAV